jgi:predicted nucleic acid-binding protein
VNFFWLDASGLIKQYAVELGTPLVNCLFSQVDQTRLMFMLEGIGEVFSALVRKRNAGTLSTLLFHQTMNNFRAEVINNPAIEKVHPTRQQVRDSWIFIERYSLNSTDAVILCCALDKATELRAFGHNIVLVSADARLLKAAKTETLITFNPETDSQTTLDTLITPSIK